jgi:rubredoxin
MNVKMRSLVHPIYLLLNLRDGMKSYMCVICGFVYEEEKGRPEDGIPPGTSWEYVPENWKCPDCGASKSDFEMIEI